MLNITGQHGWHNVALQSMGTSCTASSHSSQELICTNTIDGDLSFNSQWATDHEGIGAWIELQFNGPVYINYTRIMQRFNTIEQFKNIEFTYGQKPTLFQVNP